MYLPYKLREFVAFQMAANTNYIGTAQYQKDQTDWSPFRQADNRKTKSVQHTISDEIITSAEYGLEFS